MKNTNVLILTNNVAPYRHPLFSLVSNKFRERGAKVQIWFMRERETVRSWDVDKSEMGYQYEILTGIHFDLKKLREIHFNPSLWWKLVRLSPDIVVIGGYNSISSWIALLYCKLFRKKVIMWNGSILTSSKYNQASIKWLKKSFITSCDAFVTYGSKSKEFLEYFGVESRKIFVGCNVGDVEFFRNKALLQSRNSEGSTVKLIFVGHLVRNKGVYNLIEALTMTKSNCIHLYIVGDGEEEFALKTFCDEKLLHDRVSFVGFKQKKDLVAYYNMGDIFVLPTLSDKFGIVYSEALACGLFVIASKYAGASYDIVTEGVNGFIIDPNDIDALAACIDTTILKLSMMPTKQEISDSVVGRMELYVQQFVNAADFVLGGANDAPRY